MTAQQKTLTLGQWLDVVDLAWERSRQVPWYERGPFFSLIACVALYVKLYVGKGNPDDMIDYDKIIALPIKIDVSQIDGLDLTILGAGNGEEMERS